MIPPSCRRMSLHSAVQFAKLNAFSMIASALRPGLLRPARARLRGRIVDLLAAFQPVELLKLLARPRQSLANRCLFHIEDRRDLPAGELPNYRENQADSHWLAQANQRAANCVLLGHARLQVLS